MTRLLVDHNGTLWVATNDGLNRFDRGDRTLHSLQARPAEEESSTIWNWSRTEKGALWLGTDSSGLHRFDPATGQFTSYEHDMDRPGTLSDNRVNSVHFDRSGTMWVGTQNGLDKFDSEDGHVHRLHPARWPAWQCSGLHTRR